MRNLSCWACMFSLTLIGAAHAQTYTIKLKNNPDQGKSAVNKDTNRNSGTVKITDANGKVLRNEKTTEVRELEFTETVLARDKEDVVKYTKTFAKAVQRVGDKEKKLSYAGRMVVFERKAGKWEVAVQGEPPLDDADRKDLEKRANESKSKDMEKIMLPPKPVKVGDRWTVDAKAFAKLFGSDAELDADLTKASGTLAKSYRKGESQYGILKYDLKMGVKEMRGLKFEKPAVMDMQLTLDAAIDGSDTAGVMTMTGKMLGKATLEQGGMKFTLEMNLDMDGKLEVSSQK